MPLPLLVAPKLPCCSCRYNNCKWGIRPRRIPIESSFENLAKGFRKMTRSKTSFFLREGPLAFRDNDRRLYLERGRYFCPRQAVACPSISRRCSPCWQWVLTDLE